MFRFCLTSKRGCQITWVQFIFFFWVAHKEQLQFTVTSSGEKPFWKNILAPDFVWKSFLRGFRCCRFQSYKAYYTQISLSCLVPCFYCLFFWKSWILILSALSPLRIFLLYGLAIVDNNHTEAIMYMRLCWVCVSWYNSVRSVPVFLPSEILFSVASSMLTISFSSFHICLPGCPIYLQSLLSLVHWGLFSFHLSWLLQCSVLRVDSEMN